MSRIHPQAIVDSSARLHENVAVGPFSIIGPDVEIGADTEISSHVTIYGSTVIGARNTIFQFAVIGEKPIDYKFQNEKTYLEIGDNNVIREGVILHRGTGAGGGLTKIGDDNLLMFYSHVGHDCQVGNRIKLGATALLGGHVEVGDEANLSSAVCVHQNCTIGKHSFCGVNSVILQDVPAYVLASGQPARAVGINDEGLRRAKFSQDVILKLRKAFRALYHSNQHRQQAIEQLEQMALENQEIDKFLASIKASRRGVVSRSRQRA